MTDDYLDAMNKLWTGDIASHDGPFVAFKEVRSTPRPLQSPRPPVWVGGHSEAAIRRAVRFGDAWHPMRVQVDWLRATGMPRLRQIAADEGKRVPALCPRIKLALSDSALPEEEREPGVGTLDQVRGDLAELQAMGAEYVLLDTYMDDPAATVRHEPAWTLFTTMAERVLDLGQESLR